MKNLRYIIFILFIIFFSGCSINKTLDVVYETKNKEDYEIFVNKIEENMKKCYENKNGGFLNLAKYILREDYFNPRYSKFKIVYPFLIDSELAFPYYSTL